MELVAVVFPPLVSRVRAQVAPSAPAANPMLVRNAEFWRTPVVAAPASPDVRKESRGTGVCCDPKVPGFAPVGSTLLVRQTIATGQFEVNRSAPVDPTGSPRRVFRTSITSTTFPAGTTNDLVTGEALLVPLA